MAVGRPSERAEFGLALECCRWGFRRHAGACRAVFPSRYRLVAIPGDGCFHASKASPQHFLSENKIRAPPEVVDKSHPAAAANTATQNLKAAADCRKLLAAFDAAGVPLLFVKGLTVGALVYRNPLLKTGWWTSTCSSPGGRPHERPQSLLERAGLRARAPENRRRPRSPLAPRRTRTRFGASADPQVNIELHPRLVDNPSILPGVGSANLQRKASRSCTGDRCRRSPPDELFAYLCVHGASSAWFRLKWIADLAGLVQSMASGDALDALYRRSRKLGAAHAAGQALLLADALFGTLDGVSRFAQELSNDRGNGAPLHRRR